MNLSYTLFLLVGLFVFASCAESEKSIAMRQAEPLCKSVRKVVEKNEGKLNKYGNEICDCLTDKISDFWVDRYDSDELENLGGGLTRAKAVVRAFTNKDVQNDVTSCVAGKTGMDEAEVKETLEIIRGIIPGI